jgi:hydrogenase small subunit
LIWLQGSCDCGCSISLINRISSTAPQTVDDLLLNSVELAFHPTLMAAAGDLAVSTLRQYQQAGNYILVVEGGVPEAFGGRACVAWKEGDHEVTFGEAVSSLAPAAAKIICIGQCACFGGVGASGKNPTHLSSISAYTNLPTVNVAGCPAHPDWFIWTAVQLILGQILELDAYSRPTQIYGATVHSMCPLRGTEEAGSLGVSGHCLRELGCRGPETDANCPVNRWNGGVSWCVEAGAPCIGCTSPSFPSAAPFYKSGD